MSDPTQDRRDWEDTDLRRRLFDEWSELTKERDGEREDAEAERRNLYT
jgi:hypothetical protein